MCDITWRISVLEGGGGGGGACWVTPPGKLNDVFLSIESNSTRAVHEFVLDQNYPNPFNHGTAISFNLPHAGNVSLNIYDICGRVLHKDNDKIFPAGRNKFYWQPQTDMASGVYYYSLRFAGQVLTRKFIYLK